MLPAMPATSVLRIIRCGGPLVSRCSTHGRPTLSHKSHSQCSDDYGGTRGYTAAGPSRPTFGHGNNPAAVCHRIARQGGGGGGGGGVSALNACLTQALPIHTSPVSRVVLRSKFPDVDLPEMPLTEYCFKDSESYGDRLALINAETEQSYTYSQLKDAIWRVSSGLARYGVRKGDVVMMISSNNPEFVIMFHSILSLGAVVTMVNPTYKVEEIVTQINDSQTSYIYADEPSIALARGARDAVTRPIKKLFVLGRADGCVPFSELQSDDGTARPLTVYVDPMDTAVLPYSSGTTGLPKGVMLTHYGNTSNIQQSENDAFYVNREGAIQVGFLPFYHMFAGYANLILAPAWGQTTVTMSKFEPHLFYGSIEKYKADKLFLVPPVIIIMCKDVLADRYDLSSMKRLICGAAPLGTDLASEFRNKYQDVHLGQAYGMTETGPMITLNPWEDCVRKPGAAGKVVPNTEVKFMNYETGAECGVGERGELWARGPQMMKGYLNNPMATAETLDEQQWLHTGDIGYYDEEEHIFIVDRLKELIKYKGRQVAPAELEALLLNHPKVKDVGVTAVPDDVAGELPRAYVVLKPDCYASEDEMKAYVSKHAASYKSLRGGVEFLAEIPKTASGKILRRVLREMATESMAK